MAPILEPNYEPDYYADLGVTPLENHSEIRKAYEILIAGVNLLGRSENPSTVAHTDEERQTLEKAWAILGDEKKRKQYDLRRDSTTPTYGRYTLGYEPLTGMTRRPSAPKTRYSDPSDVLAGLERCARGGTVESRSSRVTDIVFDGLLEFGKPARKSIDGKQKEGEAGEEEAGVNVEMRAVGVKL